MKAIGRSAPVHYPEPFRTGYGRWEPSAPDFLADLRGAVAGGAAGWCSHYGSSRGAAEERPPRSFDLHTRRLFDQLGEDERNVIAQAALQVRGTAADAHGLPGVERHAEPPGPGRDSTR
jgi:hypothetical protein